LLDRIKAPRVFLGPSNDVLPVKRKENKLEIAVKGRGDLRLVENSMAPREDKEKGGTTKTIEENALRLAAIPALLSSVHLISVKIFKFDKTLPS
jgi:hypothetical protein